MRTRIAVKFLPAAAFELALRRGMRAFAARPQRQRVPEPGLLDQPLPPRPAGRGRTTRRRAFVPASPARLWVARGEKNARQPAARRQQNPRPSMQLV